MSELRANPGQEALETQEPNGLLIEAVDERALEEARERQVARLRVLWKRRRLLLRAALWGLAVSTALAFLIPKRYQSAARLMPPNQSLGAGTAMLAALSSRAGGGLATTAASTLGLRNTSALFVAILKSDTVQDDVIRKCNLQTVYKTRYIQDARKVLAAHTNVSEELQSGIITITVTDHDPARAAAMAQEYAQQLNWVVTHLSTSSAHRERVFLEERLKQVKANLDTAEQQFSQFASQKGAIDIPTQGKAMVTAAATLQGQLIATEAELQGLRQIYTNKNMRVRAVQAQVDQLRGALEQIGGKDAGEKSTIGELYPSLRELPLLGVTYADLLRRTKVEEAVFATLTQEYELAKVEEAREIPTVKVLDPPEVPQRKSFPPRLLIMALGTILAFVAGTAWVLGQAAWEATETADPRKALVTEAWGDMRATLPWGSPDGAERGQAAAWLRKKLRRPRVESGQASDRLDASENSGAGETEPEERRKD